MDVLWAALGVIVVVVFVLFILAQHWEQLLRQQSRAIRQLSRRVQDLEDMANPELRRRLGEAAPVPLEQVFTFSMRLGEKFWREAVRVTDTDRKYIHEYGSFLASVKLERWRSHTVATVSEILPARKSAGLQTRALDYYPNASGADDALTLWELALERPAGAGMRPRSLELLLRGDALELRASGPSSDLESSGNGTSDAGHPQVLLYLPLDPAQLEEFRKDDLESEGEEDHSGNGSSNETTPHQRVNSASYWHAFYSGSDEGVGINWELRLRDLGKKAEWEHWHVWDSRTIPVGSD